MISLIDYVTYRKEEGPVKIIRLPHFGVEFHWDSRQDEIIQEIREQLLDASLYRKTFDCWFLVKENKECHLYFSDTVSPELLSFQIIDKKSYEYTREDWLKIWNEEEDLDLDAIAPKINEPFFDSVYTRAKAEIISIEVCQSNHGGFLKSVAHAFHKADRENKEIIRDAWYKLIKKYSLEEEYKQAIEEHQPEYLEGYK